MLTVETLRAWGANVDEALVRCLNNETFYLKLVNKTLQDPSVEKLAEAIEAGDLEKAFDLAHSIKGVTANLALTPIYQPVAQITDLLRNRTEMDYGPLMKEITEKKKELAAL